MCSFSIPTDPALRSMMKAVSGSVFESHEADAGKITQRRRYSSTGRGGDVNSVLTIHRIEEEGNLIVIGQGSSHVAGEASCARMGPKKLVGAQEASPAGYTTPKPFI